MKDTIVLNDKIYISAKRAATIFGYTSDYVGQLCRQGKIECTMVGRSWFVKEESVLSHKLSNSEFFTNDNGEHSSTTNNSSDEYSKISKEILSTETTSTNVDANLNSNNNSDTKFISLIDSKVNDNSVSNIIQIYSKNKYSKFDISLVLVLFIISTFIFGKNIIPLIKFNPNILVSNIMNGLAIAPSSKIFENDEIIKQNLRNPFSDEVNIKPDSNGTSGVITPVFRESNGDEFLYVMVPVKDSNMDLKK